MQSECRSGTMASNYKEVKEAEKLQSLATTGYYKCKNNAEKMLFFFF